MSRPALQPSSGLPQSSYRCADSYSRIPQAGPCPCHLNQVLVCLLRSSSIQSQEDLWRSFMHSATLECILRCRAGRTAWLGQAARSSASTAIKEHLHHQLAQAGGVKLDNSHDHAEIACIILPTPASVLHVSNACIDAFHVIEAIVSGM